MFLESLNTALWVSLWYLIIGTGTLLVVCIPLGWALKKWNEREEQKARVRRAKKTEDNFLRDFKKEERTK